MHKRKEEKNVNGRIASSQKEEEIRCKWQWKREWGGRGWRKEINSFHEYKASDGYCCEPFYYAKEKIKMFLAGPQNYDKRYFITES